MRRETTNALNAMLAEAAKVKEENTSHNDAMTVLEFAQASDLSQITAYRKLEAKVKEGRYKKVRKRSGKRLVPAYKMV